MRKRTLIALGISGLVSVGSGAFLLLNVGIDVPELIENAGLALFTGSLFAIPSYFVYLSRDNEQSANQKASVFSLLFREVKICDIEFERERNVKILEDKQEIIQSLYYQLIELERENFLSKSEKQKLQKLQDDIFRLCENINKLLGIISSNTNEETLKESIKDNLKAILNDINTY